MKRVSFQTLGCKLNYAETHTITRQFREGGFEVVDARERADVVVINTCSVTENADRECRKLIRRALRISPGAYVIVIGCYAQLRPEELASIHGVDLVLGTREKFEIFRRADGFRKGSYPRVEVSDIAEVDTFIPSFAADGAERSRAFLKVQDGCDYTCSFCTIPMARGASRSRGVEETLRDAREIIVRGFHEIVLSGVNVGDYGRKIGSSFHALLQGLISLDGDFRLRISSIEPNLLSDEIIALTSSSDRMCRHFHIPLQSGSDEILRAMRRRYTASQFRDRVLAAREAMPDCCIGVDVIVGFPSETDERFLETYELLRDLPVSYLHVFSYSARPGTDAEKQGRVPVEPEERSRRSAMLRTLSEKKRLAFYQEHLGTTMEVVLEHPDANGVLSGFTGNYIRVKVPDAGPELQNARVRVRLDTLEEGMVQGSLKEQF